MPSPLLIVPDFHHPSVNLSTSVVPHQLDEPPPFYDINIVIVRFKKKLIFAGVIGSDLPLTVMREWVMFWFTAVSPVPDFGTECFLTSQNSPHILRRLKSNDSDNKSIKWSLRTYEYGNNASENNRTLSG